MKSKVVQHIKYNFEVLFEYFRFILLLTSTLPPVYILKANIVVLLLHLFDIISNFYSKYIATYTEHKSTNIFKCIIID